MVGGACVKNVSRVERPTAVAKERPESVILDIFFSNLLLAFFLGSCNRSLVVQVACWACVPNKRAVNLAQNYALNKKYALNSEQRLTTSFYGIIHNGNRSVSYTYLKTICIVFFVIGEAIETHMGRV